MRRAAARGRADSCQPECIRAIKLLGLPFRVLSANGGGVGDILVLIPERDVGRVLPEPAYFLEVECKVPQNKSNSKIWKSQYTKAQREWREQTPNAPRITVTGFEDTLRQLRELMGSGQTTSASSSGS